MNRWWRWGNGKTVVSRGASELLNDVAEVVLVDIVNRGLLLLLVVEIGRL